MKKKLHPEVNCRRRNKKTKKKKKTTKKKGEKQTKINSLDEEIEEKTKKKAKEKKEQQLFDSARNMFKTETRRLTRNNRSEMFIFYFLVFFDIIKLDILLCVTLNSLWKYGLITE